MVLTKLEELEGEVAERAEKEEKSLLCLPLRLLKVPTGTKELFDEVSERRASLEAVVELQCNSGTPDDCVIGEALEVRKLEVDFKFNNQE
jgi:hypothetical protein